MILPNVVIIGAPKCGTSTFFTWLSAHPKVSGSTPKETFYLMDPVHPLCGRTRSYHTHGLEGYSHYFIEAGREPAKVRVEATTHYLYQRTALEVLAGLQPAPRIIVLLRHPAERVYSSYQYTRNTLGNMDEDMSFSEYVRLAEAADARAFDGRIRGTSAYVLANDLRHSQYVEFLPPWRDRFGDRLHIWLLEQLRRDARGVMKDVASHLGLTPSFYDTYDFPVRNETYRVRSQAVHRLARRARSLVSAPAAVGLLKQVYFGLQGEWRRPERSAEDAETLLRLDERFRPYNRQLAHALGLDLTCWR